MPASRLLPTLLVLLGLAVFAAILLFYSGPSGRSAGEMVAEAPAASPPSQAPASTPSGEAQPASSQAQQSAAPAQQQAAAPAPTAPSATKPADVAKPANAATGPAFDVVRIEPNGDAVIAGRGVPGATVDLLRNGIQHDRVVSDPSGLFAMTPPPLPVGEHELMLRFTAPDGSRTMAAQTVTVVIAPNKTDRPMIALAAPDKPTVVLSRPEAEQKPAADATPPVSAPGQVANASPQGQVAGSAQNPGSAQTSAPGTPQAVQGPAPRPNGPVRIDAVDSESGGKMFVSGRAAPGATVRLYLNDSYLASGTAGPDGKLSFSIQSGVTGGDYKVRLDEVDSVSGQVKARAEAPFNAPALTAAAPAPGAIPTPGTGTSAPPAPANDSSLSQAQVAAPQAGSPASGAQADAGQAANSAGAMPAPSNAQVAAATPAANGGSIVVVPEIKTTIVSRGDSLWRISRRVYGSGVRYTVIYDANDTQIRNPNLIYPGQVFVLPGQDG